MKNIYPDYNNSILNVTNSILKYYGVNNKYNTIPLLDDELSKGYNHIIYILLDGMGVNIINEHLEKHTGIRKNVRKNITSVFPPTTVAATDAVLSGVPPIVNGHLGWTQYFEKEDTNNIVFLNVDYYTSEQQAEDLREKYLKFDTIYKQINDANPNIQTNEFFPSFRKGGSESFAMQVDRVLLVTHNVDQSFNYVYWTEPDLTSHLYGIHSHEVKTVLNNLNKDFEELINNVADDTLVICIADHGLTNIEEIPLFEYNDVTDLLLRKPSIEPRATSFFVKEGKLDEFKQNFNKHFSKYFDLYTKEEMIQSKLFGDGEPHKLAYDFIGDFFSIAIDKYMFTFNESKGYVGHHAGISEDEMIVPLIIYSNKKR